jgi:hypothetical protein
VCFPLRFAYLMREYCVEAIVEKQLARSMVATLGVSARIIKLIERTLSNSHSFSAIQSGELK